MKNQKLLDSLKTIKKYCGKHYDNNCDGCKFYDDDPYALISCRLVKTYPCEWHPWDLINNPGSDE